MTKCSSVGLLLFLAAVPGCSGSLRTAEPSSSPKAGPTHEQRAHEVPSPTGPVTSGNELEPSLNANPSESRKQEERNPKLEDSPDTLAGYDQVSSKTQPFASSESVEMGRGLYQTTCSRCHGPTGQPAENNPTLARYEMTHLAVARNYKYGADAHGIYRSIAFGTAAPPHGTYKDIYSDKEIWDITNFVLSLQRP